MNNDLIILYIFLVLYLITEIIAIKYASLIIAVILLIKYVSKLIK